MAQEQKRILDLIDKLPIHDGHLPIEDKVEGGILTMGAHGAANAYETELAGIIKAYAISDKLREAAQGESPITALQDIAHIAVSPDGAESVRDGRVPQALQKSKIDALDLSEPVKNLVAAIVDAQTSAYGSDSAALIARASALQSELKPQAASEVFTPEIRDAAAAKFYQITDTNLYNQSSVRLGFVPGREKGAHPNLQAAADACSDDETQRQKAVSAFIHNLRYAPTLQGKTIQIFDIGHGDGKTAAAAVRMVRQIRPGVEIDYTGTDIIPGPKGDALREKTRTALIAAGLPEDHIHLSESTFGLPQTADGLKPLEGKMDLVLASHLYNFKEKKDFISQVESLQKPDGIAYLIHENANSWAGNLRSRHADSVRPEKEDHASILRNELDVAGRDYAKFEAPTNDRIIPMAQEDLDYFKALPQGVFQGAAQESGSRQQSRKLAEYFLRAPLEAFSAKTRGALLDDLQATLAKGDLTRNSEAQLVLSAKNQSKELSDAVHQAALATQQELNQTQAQGPERFIGNKPSGRALG